MGTTSIRPTGPRSASSASSDCVRSLVDAVSRGRKSATRTGGRSTVTASAASSVAGHSVRATATRTGAAKSRTSRTEFDPSGLPIAQVSTSSTAVRTTPARRTRCTGGTRAQVSPVAASAATIWWVLNGSGPLTAPSTRAAPTGSSAPSAIHHGPAGPPRKRPAGRAPHHHAAAASRRNAEASGLVAPATAARTAPTGPADRRRPPAATSARTATAAPRPNVVRPLHWLAAQVAAATPPATVQRAGAGRSRPSRAVVAAAPRTVPRIPARGRPSTAPAHGETRLYDATGTPPYQPRSTGEPFADAHEAHHA